MTYATAEDAARKQAENDSTSSCRSSSTKGGAR